MGRFGNGFVTLILKDHENDSGNTPPNGSLWDVKSFTDWEKAESYGIDDYVFSGGFYYISKTVHTSSNLNIPPNDTNWTRINKWANGVDYVLTNRIVYQDIIYQCISAHTSIYGPDENGDIDISDKFVTIEHNDKVPQSLKLIFNSRNGRFMTRNPIIEKFNRIYYRYEDHDGIITEDVFHVGTKKRQRRHGRLMELECPHQTEYEWKKTISFPGRKISGDAALIETVRQLNINRGDNDPIISIPAVFDLNKKTGSRLAKNSANDYIFESVKLSQVFKKIKGIEQLPFEAGGKLQAFYIRFKSKYDHDTHTGLDEAEVQAFEQGFTKNGSEFNNTPKVTLLWNTIESGAQTTILDLDTDEEPPKATNIIAIGNTKSGDYLGNYTKYIGAKDVFQKVPKLWVIGVNYNFGDLVTFDGVTSECILDNLSSLANRPDVGPSNTWITRTFIIPDNFSLIITYAKAALVVFNDIAYKSIEGGNLGNDPAIFDDKWTRVNFVPIDVLSPLTKNSVQDYINAMAGSKYADQNIGRTGVVDANCIIHDTLHPRNPVRAIIENPDDVPTSHKIPDTPSNRIPDGYKVLVAKDNGDDTLTDSGTGIFAGNDSAGRPFPGNIAEYIDTNNDGNGVWTVFKETSQDEEIFDWDEALSWIKNPCTAFGSAVNGSGECIIQLLGIPVARDTVWKKGSYVLFALPGGGPIGLWSDGRHFDCFHIVNFSTELGHINVTQTKISKDDTDVANPSGVNIKFSTPGGIYNSGFFIGYNFWSLTPLTTNSVPTGNSPIVGSKIKLSIYDINNMHLTSDGTIEWFGPKCEEYYPLQSISFLQRIIDEISSFNIPNITAGDYNFSIFLVDRRHNVVKIKYTLNRNRIALDKDVQFGKMAPYIAVVGTAFPFSPEEPETLDVFQPREWQFGGVQSEDSYDNDGRYEGNKNRFWISKNLEIATDLNRFVKPLVVTNVDELTNKPDRNIETTRQYFSNIISYPQMKNLVRGLARLFGFERKTIKHRKKASNSISFGDPVYTKDTLSFSENDDGNINTILAVADNIITTHSRPTDGQGGSIQFFSLVTRLFP